MKQPFRIVLKKLQSLFPQNLCSLDRRITRAAENPAPVSLSNLKDVDRFRRSAIHDH